MSHNFLMDTYSFLRRRLDAVQPRLTAVDVDRRAKLHTAGRIEAICALESFLQKNIDIKLPRRLRRQRASEKPICACTGQSD